MNNQPVNRLELIDRLFERLEEAKAADCELVFLEPWELAWLIVPEKLRNTPDDDGTAAIAFDFEPFEVGDDITRRHVPITVVNAESYIKRLDCGAETQQCETE